MKLYTSLTSPYGRIARIVIIEKGLQDRVAIMPAKTRTADSPYYDINPSGRVPYLLLDDGTGFEESAVISAYLDHVDGEPSLQGPEAGPNWETRRLDAMARSMLDGVSLWSREFIYRPAEIRSDFIVDHEAARAHRLADAFEREMDNPVLTGPLNMAQITLGVTLVGREARLPDFDWRPGRPKLAAWTDKMAKRLSFEATTPPDH